MPKTTRSGEPRQSELPDTLKRSDKKAQRTFAEAHDSAMDQYHDEERAHKVAWAAVKQTHEKVGDRWQPKGRSGPSDKQTAGGRRTTAGGVDANASKEHLYKVAKKLDVHGRSTMTKAELVDAIGKANDKASRRARG
ncbi:ChaB family protein [Xylanimonas sp. McL0601]|uniref:ChaB family protein n=1 Tax=Xylanimonas sp. McL0601 TaxID=3414739 RepID=UPI003CE9BD86